MADQTEYDEKNRPHSPRGLTNPIEQTVDEQDDINIPPSFSSGSSDKRVVNLLTHPHLWFLNGGSKTIDEVREIIVNIAKEEAKLHAVDLCLGPIRLIPLQQSATSAVPRYLYRVVMLPLLADAIRRSPRGQLAFGKTPTLYRAMPVHMAGRKEDLTHTLTLFPFPRDADPLKVKQMMEHEIQILERFGFATPRRVSTFFTARDPVEWSFAHNDPREPTVTAIDVAWTRLLLHGLDYRPYLDTPYGMPSKEMDPSKLLRCRWKRAYRKPAPPPLPELRDTTAAAAPTIQPIVSSAASAAAVFKPQHSLRNPDQARDMTTQGHSVPMVWYSFSQCPQCGFHITQAWVPSTTQPSLSFQG